MEALPHRADPRIGYTSKDEGSVYISIVSGDNDFGVILAVVQYNVVELIL